MSNETEAAYILFGADKPKSAETSDLGMTRQPPVQPAQDHAKAVKPDQPAGHVDPDEAARRLFDTEAEADPAQAEYSEALQPLDKLSESARLAGEDERAAQLTEANEVLMSEALEHGMPAADFRDLIGQVHEASGTMSELTADQLSDGKAKAMRELADVTAADLDLARGLINQMSGKIPNLVYQLEATGLGNNPKFVRAVVKEARRRAGR